MGSTRKDEVASDGRIADSVFTLGDPDLLGMPGDDLASCINNLSRKLEETGAVFVASVADSTSAVKKAWRSFRTSRD